MDTNKEKTQYDEYAFGKYIRKRRKELGLSCRRLAEMLGMSVVYLSCIELGTRKAPFSTKNGKDYMEDLVLHLRIKKEDISTFYEMAAATRCTKYTKSTNISTDILTYLEANKSAQVALRLAKEVNLSDEEWKIIISHIVESKINDSL